MSIKQEQHAEPVDIIELQKFFDGFYRWLYSEWCEQRILEQCVEVFRVTSTFFFESPNILL
jgi:hypothetical protein